MNGYVLSHELQNVREAPSAPPQMACDGALPGVFEQAGPCWRWHPGGTWKAI